MAFNAGGAFQGGMSGASAGAAAGPWGALAGGVLGALGGGFLGGGDSGKLAKDLLGRQMDRQEIWMKNQMQWRVEDAKLAGIHPLAAIGSNITAPSVPGVSVGDVGSGLSADMGQGIGRAIGAMMSDDQKYETTIRALQVERGELENQILAKQLRDLHSQPSWPANHEIPVGQEFIPVGTVSRLPPRGAGLVQTEPLRDPLENVVGYGKTERKLAESLTTLPGTYGAGEAGIQPDYQLLRTGEKTWSSKPSSHYQIDDLTSPNWLTWQVRNSVLPAMGYKDWYPEIPVSQWPRGTVGFTYNPFTGNWSALDYIPEGDPYFISAAEMVMKRR